MVLSVNFSLLSSLEPFTENGSNCPDCPELIEMPRQQTDAPSTQAIEEDPEELDQVELQIDEMGGFLVLAADWEAETPGKQNLISKLREAKVADAAKLIIKVHEDAILQSLVDGMDAGTIAGYSEIQVTQVEQFD